MSSANLTLGSLFELRTFSAVQLQILDTLCNYTVVKPRIWISAWNKWTAQARPGQILLLGNHGLLRKHFLHSAGELLDLILRTCLAGHIEQVKLE